MGAEDPEVLRSAALVLLAACAELEHFSELPALQQLGNNRQLGAIARLKGDRHLDVVLLGGGDHLVGLGERAAEGFFQVHALHSTLGRGEKHVAMLVDPSRADADQVGLHFVEHASIVGILFRGLEPLGGLSAAFLVGIGDGDDFRLGNIEPGLVQIVAVVAPAGVADHGHAVFARALGAADEGRQGQAAGQSGAGGNEPAAA